MKRALSALLLFLGLASAVEAKDYIVVDLVGRNDPYYGAATRLAELRGGEIISADINNLASVLEAFRAKPPRYVAVVVRPDDFDVNLARSFLKIATEVDRDPFVDFAYGFITGDTPEVAIALAERGSQTEKKRREPTIALAAVGEQVITQSGIAEQSFPLRKARLPQLWGQIAGAENFRDEGRDAKFIKELMPRLQGKSMIMFAGHGLPGEVLGGPTSKDLAGLRLDGAVVMNIACLTGVTGRWFDEDWEQGKKHERKVTKEESFCLAMLRTGVGAYVAYACPRPAGPELFSDFAALAAEGLSVGEVRRRDYNRIVLACLAVGEKGLKISREADGQAIQRPGDLVKDMLLEMATGGLVFGDPQFTPFVARPEEIPRVLGTERVDTGLRVSVSIAGEHIFFECSDPLAMWSDDEQAMRVLATVPLGKQYVSAVDVAELKMGNDLKEKRLVWAVEESHGERFLHVKVNFPMPSPEKQAALPDLVNAVFQVETTRDAGKARSHFVSGQPGR
jgi:hypothetical protein